MSWKCPVCKRPFKHKNQDHSCIRIHADDHFLNKNIVVKEIYENMMAGVSKFGDVKISPAVNAIMIVRGGTFLAVKPKREWLDIEFLLNRKIDDFRIHKTVWASKSRCAHFIRIESPGEVDKQLIDWLREAYESRGE